MSIILAYNYKNVYFIFTIKTKHATKLKIINTF